MLAPRASNAFVCIRCELQLARRRLPAYPRRTSHANFSTALRLQDGADELEALSQGPPPALKIIREKPQLDRIRKRKGKVIRETSARLGGGMKRLGDDAEILVLREVADNQPPEVSVEPDQAEPLPVPDIVGSLKKEHEALTPEEIHNQLESLRPKIHANPDEPLYVPLKAFIKLIRDMNSGFSREQLSQFYSAAKNVQQEELRKEVIASLKGTGTDQRTTLRSNWQPGNTPIARRLPGVDIDKRNKRIPVSKHLLVDRIIRDLWKLVPMEEDEALGEIELSLKPWQVTMLNSGDEDTLLNKISRVRKAKIEIHQQHSVLRITADRTTAEYVADDIEEALRNVETKKVQLKAWIPWLEKAKVPEDQKLATIYTEEDFRMVTSLTRASIQRMDNTNTLVIRGLNKGAVAEAERTLIQLLPFKDSTLHTIDTQEVDAAKGQGHLLPASYDAKSLEMRQRNTDLGRWYLPVGRKTQVENPKAHDAEPEPIERVPETLATRKNRAAAIVRSLQQMTNKGLALDQAARAESDELVNEGPKFKLSADFGQALFPLMDTAPSGKSKSKPSSTSQPLFTSSIPGLSSLLSSAYTQSLTNVEPSPHFQPVNRVEELSLLYDFVAAPEQEKLEAGQTPPTLRIQMRTDKSGGKATFRKLGLCFQEHVHNVLLPGDAVDVQFTRYGRIHHYKDSPKMKLVEPWVEVVSANIASGERLTAPDLTFQVPKYTVVGAKGHGTLPVKYLFSGVQFRQAMNGTYDDEPASYATVQSGKLGAQGGALSMYYKNEETSAEELLKDHGSLTSFVEKALGFAATITKAAGQTQAVAKTLRPRSGESERKQRRRGEQAATEDGAPIRRIRGGEGRLVAGRFQRDQSAGTVEITGDIMSLLDDAVDQSPLQSQAVQDNGANGTEIHDRLLKHDSVEADEEWTAPSSEQTSTEDMTGSPSSTIKSE